MRSFLFLAAALIAVPATAGTFSAKPSTPVAAGKIIGKDISWSCAGDSCSGSTDFSRPMVLCQDLAKRAGTLDSFVADGRPIDAAELAKCNKSAKGAAPTALAKAN